VFFYNRPPTDSQIRRSNLQNAALFNNSLGDLPRFQHAVPFSGDFCTVPFEERVAMRPQQLAHLEPGFAQIAHASRGSPKSPQWSGRPRVVNCATGTSMGRAAYFPAAATVPAAHSPARRSGPSNPARASRRKPSP